MSDVEQSISQIIEFSEKVKVQSNTVFESVNVQAQSTTKMFELSGRSITNLNEINNKDILKNRDLNVQSTYVSQYLNSKFNSDLFRDELPFSSLNNYIEEADEFFREVLGSTAREAHDRDVVCWFYLTYYFLVTIKNIEPAVFNISSGQLIKKGKVELS